MGYKREKELRMLRLLGAGGQSLRLFQLLQGPDWNLLAYETHGKVIDARRGLRIHHIGEQDELIDTLGHFRESVSSGAGSMRGDSTRWLCRRILSRQTEQRY